VLFRISFCLCFLLFLGLVSCADDKLDTVEPFTCTSGNCCKLRLKLHSDCVDVVDLAEVVLDEALEPEPLTYGTTFTSIGDIPNGEKRTYWVRSEDIQWGPLTVQCPNGNNIVSLSCCSEDNKDACQ